MPLLRGQFDISEELLRDLRSKFLEEVNSGPEAAGKYHPDDVQRVRESDWFIARYLMHQELNVDKALKMMKQSLQFRQEMEVNTLKKEDFPESYFEARTLQIYNVDNENNPVLALRFKAHTKNSEETRQFQQYVLYWMEKAVRQNDWGIVVILCDLTDAKYKNMDLDLLRFILTILQHHYPWTLHLFLVYNMPWYLSAIWKIFKSMVPERYLYKVIFVDNDSLPEYIDKDKIPVCMGGTCTDKYDSKVAEETSDRWF